MVGWGFAFGRGFVILLWTIAWAIVAGIIAVFVTGLSVSALIANPTSILSNPVAFLGTFFLGIFLSVFIVVVGMYASIVKVTVDGAIRQMEKLGTPQGPSYTAMGVQPTMTAPMLRKYCPNCGNSIPGGSPKCPSCGALL
ncbi:MAG TPA: zinc ribbon domain-containing protein [Candidatus Dormibacteraeota bacterium]|jgi:hypothetical protein|nr:zinc ribbon domain-containing protein [Candidatus Dormibacteraeota bacterium]